MEQNNHHQKTSSRDTFSSPRTPGQDQDSDFEFGCFTPDFPSTDDPFKTSPADHLFYNGRLLPHSFPVVLQQPKTTPMVLVESISRASSRTSSVSSKDSFMSSRSNSVNSSRSSVSSSSSSSRTSWSSDNSERRMLYHSTKLANRTPMASKVVMVQLYGSSQRWQHAMPIPTLKREDSRRKSGGFMGKQGLKSNKRKADHQQGKKDKSSGICRRFFMSFLVACRECHAMEPSRKDHILQGIVEL